jgi:hypothetical protein
MMVSLSIMFIITAIAITGQSTFNQSLLLNDTAYTVALSARQAQSLGLSSRKFNGVQNGGYGMHLASANPNSYLLFADVTATAAAPSWCPAATVAGTPEDKAGNCLYDGINETFQTYALTKGFTISDFCGKTGTGLKCMSTGDINSLDVVFLRPNTISILTGLLSGPSGTKSQFSCVQISVKSPSGSAVQTIRISQLGEVSVGQVCS